MKKSIGLLMIVIAVISMAFVSCDANTAPQADTLGEIYLSNDSQSRGITAEGTNAHEVEKLFWYYKAVKNDNGLFNTGVTNGFVPVKTNTEGTAAGLSEANLGLFSYGNWTFTFYAFKASLEGVTASNPASDESISSSSIVYQGSQTIEVNKDKNFLNLTLNEGGGLTTEIKFDTDKGVWFSHANIKKEGMSFSLAVVDKVNGVAQGTITAGTALVEDNKVSFKGIQYTAPEAGIAEGQHVMTFTLTQSDIRDTTTNIAKVATYELAYTVSKGMTYTVKGDLTSAEVKGEVSVGSYAVSVPETTASKVIPVEAADSKVVKRETPVSTLDLTVTYPEGVELTNSTETAVNGDTITADATIGFAYVGNTASSSGISVSSSETVSQYNLTLNVSNANTTKLVKVEKYIEKDLVITNIYHEGTAMKTSAGEGEYYTYNKDSGLLTLFVYHASPIDIITASLPTDEDGNYLINSTFDLELFAKLVNEEHVTYQGKTVKLTNDIDLAGITWNPIGQTGATEFKGVFDGQGHTIKNMTVNNPNEDANVSSGFFGWIEDHGEGIVIRNVKFDNANVTGSHYVGVVAGYVYGTIEDCIVSKSRVMALNVNDDANGDKVGGIVGYVGEDAFIDNNKVTNCSITGNRDIGGIAGAVANGVDSFSNNSVSNTVVKYITDKTYDSAGVIVSGRTEFVPDSSNESSDVAIVKIKLVSTLEELKRAINGMHDSDYVAFGANIVQNEVDTSSGQITPTKASDAVGEVNATIDLNGYVFDGQIGGWVFNDTKGFNLTIIGTDKVSAEYYEHETEHHMVKAHAVNLYFNDALGTMTIKDGMFVSNNAVLANGNGNLVVDNGEFVAEKGIILSTYNKGTTIINGGKFITKASNATFVELELNTRSNSYQNVTINDGTFIMEGADCAGFVIDVTTGKDYGSITINGGNFTFADNSELVVALSWTGTNSGVVDKTSLTDDGYKNIAKASVIINGGTFNIDPSEYVNASTHIVTNNGSTWTVTAKN